jgi:hypothetical protein
LKANISAANSDYLPLLQAEAQLVETERLAWIVQWQNTSEIQKNLDWQKFQQLVANETIIQNQVRPLHFCRSLLLCYC